MELKDFTCTDLFQLTTVIFITECDTLSLNFQISRFLNFSLRFICPEKIISCLIATFHLHLSSGIVRQLIARLKTAQCLQTSGIFCEQVQTKFGFEMSCEGCGELCMFPDRYVCCF